MSHVDPTPIACLELCAGLSGIALGIRRVLPGLRVIAYSEIEEFACAVLAARMEGGQIDTAPIWTDLRTLPYHLFRGKVDLLTAGFPCQPFSSAGKRKATQDPRHLWPHIERAIGIIQPGLIFLENVDGIISSKCRGEFWASDGTPVLLYVCQRLEVLGYKAAVRMVSASEVGAPHQRKRVFIGAIRRALADDHDQRQPRPEGREVGNRPVDSREAVANGTGQGFQERIRAAINSYLKQQAAFGGGSAWPSGPGEPQFWWEPPRVVNRLANAERRGQQRHGGTGDIPGSQGKADGAGNKRQRDGNAAGDGSEALSDSDSPERPLRGNTRGVGRQQEQAASISDPVGGGLEAGRKLRPGAWQSNIAGAGEGVPDTEGWVGNRGSDGPGRGSEQSEGGEQGRPDDSECQAEPTVGRGTDGLPDRLEYAELCESMDSRIDELRALGNAVVPDCAERGFVLTMSKLLGINL